MKPETSISREVKKIEIPISLGRKGTWISVYQAWKVELL